MLQQQASQIETEAGGETDDEIRNQVRKHIMAFSQIWFGISQQCRYCALAARDVAGTTEHRGG